MAFVLMLVCLAVAMYWGRQSRGPQWYEVLTPCMGTTLQVKLFAADDEAAKAESEAAFAPIFAIDALLSDYKPESQLSRANVEAAERAMVIDPDFAAVLRLANEVSERSGGAFDVTIGPLVDLWKAAGRAKALPSDSAMAAARSRVNYRLILLSGDTLRLGQRGLRLDLGAIAKGYAVDKSIAALRARGHTCAIVDAGGNLFVMGEPKPHQPFTIGIQHPRFEDSLLFRIKLKDRGISTSGDYHRFTEINGQRYNHIIDARTGWPVNHTVAVTIVAESAFLADALSTAVAVLGREDGLRLIESYPGAEGIIVEDAGDGQLKLWPSSGFDALRAP